MHGKPKSPCLNCKDRAVGCHDACEKFYTWKKLKYDWDEKVRQAKLERGIIPRH
nr:MAG TPA: hypothetical protein [Caudoviricetes sp.]